MTGQRSLVRIQYAPPQASHVFMWGFFRSTAVCHGQKGLFEKGVSLDFGLSLKNDTAVCLYSNVIDTDHASTFGEVSITLLSLPSYFASPLLFSEHLMRIPLLFTRLFNLIFYNMSLWLAITFFIGLAAIIGFAGTYLTKAADQLADITGLGEALVGGILLGAVTSISGIITSVTAAFEGQPELAFSNAVGGIAAQTVFLAVADIAYKRANLEHASASYSNLMQGVLLVAMLGFVVVAMAAEPLVIFGTHPASLVLILIYLAGTRLISKAQEHPMWKPSDTSETVEDEPDDEVKKDVNLTWLLLRFAGLAGVVGIAGYFIAQLAIIITDQSGISASFMGALFTSVATSLPELVVSVSAVRQGALTLAVSNIIGGNTFDVLFVSFADMAYQDGSIYHSANSSQLFVISLTILLTSVLLLGLLHRQKYGFAKVGWESAVSIIIFVGGYILLYLM